MPAERVLLVEDDKRISRLVKYNLEKAGFESVVVTTGEEALEVLDGQHVDLIVLDIMLPEMDGFEVCRQIKQEKRFSAIPIVMLTAKGEEIDRIVGFELGADDYVVKPFSPRELVLRVKAILRRGKIGDSSEHVLSAEKLKVDIPRHKVTVDEREIVLTPLEFSLLVTLMQRRGRVQTRDRLSIDVWDMSSDISTRTIDTHIKRLRQKLGRLGGLIETVRGLGYRFREEE